jgi:hypothetical protein
MSNNSTYLITRPPLGLDPPTGTLMAQPVKMASLAQEEAAEIKQRNWIYENLQSISPYLPDVEMGRMCTAVRRGWPRFSHPMSRTPEQFKEAGLRWLKRNKIPHVHFSQEDQIIPPAMEKAGKMDLWAPFKILPDLIYPDLRFNGLGFKGWKAFDCGEEIVMDSGQVRTNACIFQAVPKAAGVDKYLFHLQAFDAAMEIVRHVPRDQISLVTPDQEGILKAARDVLTHDQPWNPALLASLNLPCLSLIRLIFVEVPTEPNGKPQVVVLRPPTTDGAKTGFILLYQGHAWLLEPPKELTRSNADIANWLDQCSQRGHSVTETPYTCWKKLWLPQPAGSATRTWPPEHTNHHYSDGDYKYP